MISQTLMCLFSSIEIAADDTVGIFSGVVTFDGSKFVVKMLRNELRKVP